MSVMTIGKGQLGPIARALASAVLQRCNCTLEHRHNNQSQQGALAAKQLAVLSVNNVETFKTRYAHRLHELKTQPAAVSAAEIWDGLGELEVLPYDPKSILTAADELASLEYNLSDGEGTPLSQSELESLTWLQSQMLSAVRTAVRAA